MRLCQEVGWTCIRDGCGCFCVGWVPEKFEQGSLAYCDTARLPALLWYFLCYPFFNLFFCCTLSCCAIIQGGLNCRLAWVSCLFGFTVEGGLRLLLCLVSEDLLESFCLFLYFVFDGFSELGREELFFASKGILQLSFWFYLYIPCIGWLGPLRNVALGYQFHIVKQTS